MKIGEIALDASGMKMAARRAKTFNERLSASEVRRRIEEELKKREGKRILCKKGMIDAEITTY